MRVLHIYKDYYPPISGGIECQLNLLCNELKEKVEVKVLVSNTGLKTVVENVEGVEVIKVGEIGRLQSAPLSPTMPLWLRRLKSDIIHFHLPNPTAVLSYLLAKPEGGVVVTYHSDIVRQEVALKFYKPFLLRFLKRADKIVVTSPNYLQTSAILSKFEHKCRIVPYGVDLDRFKFTEEVKQRVEKIRERYGAKILLFVGKLRYYKGLQYLIRAMEEVNAKLLIIGEGPVGKELKKLVTDLDLEDKIAFLGEIVDEELLAYYHACGVFVLPSIFRSEAFGIVQLEAQACGKPVVSTNLDTGVPFVNLDGRTGLIVPLRSAQSLAKAINELLSNPHLAEEYGRTGQARVRKKFNKKAMVNKVLKVYEEVMGNS